LPTDYTDADGHTRKNNTYRQFLETELQLTNAVISDLESSFTDAKVNL